MKEIITDIEKLAEAAKPLKFINEDGSFDKETGTNIVNELREVLENTPNLLALSAPQIGIDARVIAIKFNDAIKFFINPVITKKLKYVIQGETFASMPGKEILITRPEEVTAVYYTEEFKYEDNKLLGLAARLFDQQAQLLDGVLPSELGLVSDIEYDGSLADLTEEEFKQVVEIYKQFIKSKISTLEKNIEEDADLAKEYRSLKFTESVINGKAAIVAADPKDLESYKKVQAGTALINKSISDQTKAYNRAQVAKVANKSRKHKGRK